MTRRTVVAEAGELALAELTEEERDRLRAAGDGTFDVDEDERTPLHDSRVHRLAVLGTGGELLGSVDWHATGYGRTFACGAWNVGMALLPEARGRGTGVLALRLLVQYLLTTSEVDRVEAGTDVENVPAQRVLAKVGFLAEGVLRGARLRGGKRRDVLMFGLLRSDLTPPPAPGQPREVVIERDGVALAVPVAGEREKFYVEAAGDFAIDRDDRPRITGPVRSSLLSVLDPATGALLGGVSWHAVDYGGTLGCTAWNIGIGLLPAERGRGVGTTAQRLLAEHLFATTEVDRVEASTDADNIAEQKALTRAGFTREGVLRGAQLRGGVRRDLVHYGKLRTDQ